MDFKEKLQALEQERHREQWAESKEATIRKLIEQARKQKPRPQDLPDKVSARKGTKDWYLRVWVNYDRRGKKKATHIVRLRESESDEALFQRVRAATAEALFRDEDREKREREKEFPAWAIAKKRAVEEALAEQRRREKGEEDFPDGIVLVAERQTAGPAPERGCSRITEHRRGHADVVRRRAARLEFPKRPCPCPRAIPSRPRTSTFRSGSSGARAKATSATPGPSRCR